MTAKERETWELIKRKIAAMRDENIALKIDRNALQRINGKLHLENIQLKKDKGKYELNGADARSAMLWFLKHERLRHYQDIQQAERDIEALESQGVKCPDSPPLDTFIDVPEMSTNGEK